MSVDLAQLVLSVDANGFVRADQTMTNFNQTANNSERQTDRLTRSTDRMTRSITMAERAVNQMRGAFDVLNVLKAALVGVVAAMSFHSIIEYADMWTNVSNVLRGVSDAGNEFIQTQSKIINLSKDTYSNLQGTSRLYAEITRSVGDLGVSQERVIGVTRTINNLFLAGGRSAASAAGAITQLNQGFASGVLRGDEFNSVAEGAPRILDAVSRHLGITRGALRDFAAEGGITAEILVGALEAYSAEAQRAVDISKRTFSQNSELARTFALEWVGASSAVATFSSTAGVALLAIAQNLDLVTNAALAFAVIIGSRVVAAMAAKTSETVRGIIATNAQVAAENNAALGAQRRAVVEQEAAAAAMNKARAENVAATAAVNAARANGTATQSIAALIIAQNEQAITQARLTGTLNAYTAATAAANAANARLTASTAAVASAGIAATAMRGLGTALALIGGPVGLAVIAAAGLAYFVLKAGEAEKAADALNPAVDGLTDRFAELGEAQRELALQGFSEKIDSQVKQIESLNARLNRETRALNSSGGPMGGFGQAQSTTNQDLLETRAEIEKATKALADLQAQYSLINPPTGLLQNFIAEVTNMDRAVGLFVRNAGDGVRKVWQMFENPPKVEKVSDEFKKLSAEIEKRIALFGKEGQAAELAYDIEHGNIKNLTKAEAEQLIARQKYNDAQAAGLEKQKEKYDRLNASVKEHVELLADMEKEINAGIDNSLEKSFTGLNDGFDLALENSKELDGMIKSVDDFGGAWSRTGSVIVDAFGSIADSLNDYTKMMAELAVQQEAANNFKPTNKLEEIELEKLKAKLADQSIRSQISGYGKMAGAAAAMFKENSKGRKAMNKMEQAFTAIEIALALKKAAAGALSAVVNQGQGDPYTAFPRIAAMIAIMAGLGLAVGGGSSGGGGPSAADIQESQGTGTVMGAAGDKSESIANALEGYQNIAIDQLAELRGIRSAMSALSNGIAGLAVSMVRSNKFSGAGVDLMGSQNKSIGGGLLDFMNLAPGGGDLFNKFLGDVFGKTTKKLMDTGLQLGAQELGDVLAGDFEAFYYNTVKTTKKKLFGLSKKTSTKDEMTAVESGLANEFANIFGFMADAVDQSLSVLGVDAAQAIENFQISVGKISFKDLSGEEIQAELEAIFGTQADLLAEFVLPQIAEYQKMGEGAFETLMRVSKEQAVFNDAIDQMGISLGGLSNLMRIDVAQSIIEMMGGLEEFNSKTAAYFDKFFSEEEKLSSLGSSLGEAFGSIGAAMPATHAAFREMVEALDLTSESGQELFASFMELSPALDQYIKATEKAAEVQKAEAIQALESKLAEIDAAKKARDKIIAEEDAAYKVKYDAAKQSADLSIDMIEKSIGAEKMLSQARLDAANVAFDVAQAERDAAADRYSAAESALQSSFAAEIDMVGKLRDERLGALESELGLAKENQSAASSAVSAAQNALEQALSAEQKIREESVKSQIDGYRQVAAEAEKYAQSLRSLSENLRSSISGMSAESVDLTMIRRLAAQDNVNQALSAARGGDFGAAMNLDLSALQNTDGLFTNRAERDYDIAVTQGKLLELAKLAEGQATIEEQAYQAAERSAAALEQSTQQLGSINQGVLSVAEATKQLADAQNAAASFDAIVAGLESQIANEKLMADEQTAKLQAQLDALLGNTEAVLTIDDAIKQFLDAKESLAVMDSQLETAKAALAVSQSMYDAEIAAYDQIIAQQTAMYNAAMGIDTSIKSVDVAISDLANSLLNYTEINRAQQEQLASRANQQSIVDAQTAANEKLLADEITKLRSENKELQEKMAESLKKIEDNSTKTLNRELLV